MRRLIGWVVFGSLILVAPQRADAAWGGFFDWLQELSGPGDFHGGGFEVGLFCWSTPVPVPVNKAPAAQSRASDQGPEPEVSLLCRGRSGPPDRRRPIHQFSVAYSRMVTDQNPYRYDAEAAKKSGDVAASRYGAALDFAWPSNNRPAGVRSFSLGSGFGVLRFSGDRFTSFSKPYLEPRVIYRPLAAFACNADSGCPSRWTLWDAIEVRFRVTMFGSISPKDNFGALDGNATGKHVHGGVTIAVTYPFFEKSPVRP